MQHIVRKAYYDFEKEEKWLNEMSAKGLALVNYSWCKYVFEDAPQGEYTYRLELLEKPINHPDSQNYLSFMKDTGVEMVASFNRWVYFRRKAADGEFNIYSDKDSKLKHYSRVRAFFVLAAALNFFIGLMNFSYGTHETISGHVPINGYFSIISFLVAVLFIIFLILPLTGKISALEKEKDIRE